jgi:hypothetical protein
VDEQQLLRPPERPKFERPGLNQPIPNQKAKDLLSLIINSSSSFPNARKTKAAVMDCLRSIR